MSFIIVDAVLAERLQEADDAVRICTADGVVLGYFAPAKSKRLNLKPPVSEEELDRIEVEENGRPLAEILRDLEKRP